VSHNLRGWRTVDSRLKGELDVVVGCGGQGKNWYIFTTICRWKDSIIL
jgi:hypothetical protein